MNDKLKYILAAIAAAIAIAALGIFASLWYARGTGSLMSYLPSPQENAPYILLETKEGTYPAALSSLLTEGIYARLNGKTPRGAVLAAAGAALDSAVMLEEKEGMTSVLCAARFSEADAALLNKGTLPAPLDALFGAVNAESQEGIFVVRMENYGAPLYYAVDGENVLFAADSSSLHMMLLQRKDGGGLKDKKWTQEPSWPAHIEISDGGRLTSDAKEKFPVTIEAAWHSAEDASKHGEARWAFVNVGAAARAYLFANLKPKRWNLTDTSLPQPLLLAAGFRLPQLDLSANSQNSLTGYLSFFAEALALTESQTTELLSGQTVLSLGGQNKILWFSLPGFLAQFSGRTELMRALVSNFWDNLFFGAVPDPLDGFEFGGASSVPFSVVGAGGEGRAALGLVSPQTLGASDVLSQYIAKNEEAIGWLYADLPKVGKTIAEMTKMSSFLEEEKNQDFYGSRDDKSLFPWGGTHSDPEPFQPEFSLSPFDQEIADSFGRILGRLGQVAIVWENPLSGRISWYNH